MGAQPGQDNHLHRVDGEVGHLLGSGECWLSDQPESDHLKHDDAEVDADGAERTEGAGDVTGFHQLLEHAHVGVEPEELIDGHHQRKGVENRIRGLPGVVPVVSPRYVHPVEDVQPGAEDGE